VNSDIVEKLLLNELGLRPAGTVADPVDVDEPGAVVAEGAEVAEVVDDDDDLELDEQAAASSATAPTATTMPHLLVRVRSKDAFMLVTLLYSGSLLWLRFIGRRSHQGEQQVPYELPNRLRRAEWHVSVQVRSPSGPTGAGAARQ
jgi:hypothetical protein